MKLHTFTVGPFQENTYLLSDGEQAILVDPGFAEPAELDDFSRELKEMEASLQAVLLTHAHVDHVLGLRKVLDEYKVPVYLNDTDRHLWDNFGPQAQMFGFKVEGFDFVPQNLPAQKAWSVACFTFDVFYTPGHAPDHVSLYNAENGWLIAGDALFKQGVGRTDLYKGDMQLLKKSIRDKLYTLPDETTVYPGHGPSTTIGEEKQSNPFVQG